MAASSAMVEIVGLTKEYGPISVLRDINLRIEHGERRSRQIGFGQIDAA